ncbi:MAG: T9SS type A sorting domain-containing protein, partial [Bacteroidales bacterium]|nr:T9SS type A sorting domain-containing protein [Bacteroidales bacterium]
DSNTAIGMYKNGSQITNRGSGTSNFDATDVLFRNDTCYFSYKNTTTGRSFIGAYPGPGNIPYFDAGAGSTINAMCLSGTASNAIYSFGYKKNSDGIYQACVWVNNDTIPMWLGNNNYASYATAGCMGLLNGSTTPWTITVGRQYTSSSVYQGVVWQGRTELYNLGDSISPQAVAIYNGSVYTAGMEITNTGKRIIKVWEDDDLIYTLTSSDNNAYVNDMYIDAGDIYVAGWEGSYLKVWKNGSVLYSLSAGSSNMYAVVANTDGVYYAGFVKNADKRIGKIWKNGTELYAPSNCESIKKMYIADPDCKNSTTRSLPFYESFENGATEWACWTKIDNDNKNRGYVSYWDRWGERPTNSREVSIPTGKYVAGHRFGDTIQEGWLISPKLAIPNTSNQVTLTFKSFELYEGDYTYEGVWVTTGITLGSMREVWTPANVSASWKTITVDLSAYKGQNIYIGFKYSGEDGHNWYIDDINVAEKSSTAIADADATKAQVSVYPNPAKNMLYVNGIAENSTKMVEIFDMTGRKVKQQPATENMSIDIADLAKGVYVLSAGYQKIKFVKE